MFIGKEFNHIYVAAGYTNMRADIGSLANWLFLAIDATFPRNKSTIPHNESD